MEDSERFIAACLSSRREKTVLLEAEQLARSSSFSWAAVLEQALDQRCGPLLYSVLKNETFVPPGIKQRLQLAYETEALRNAVLLHRLQRLLAHMQQAGVPVMVLKGAALAESIYKNVALRPMSDVDILVQRADLDRALGALSDIGYVRHKPEERTGMFAAFENEVMLGDPAAPELSLELHWSLLDSPHYQRVIDESWLWETAAPLYLDDKAQMLGPEAQVLHLAAHLVLHHEGTELLWLNDIAEVLHHTGDNMDWQLLLRKAIACDLVLPLQRVLPDLAAAWQAPVPPSILAQVAQLEPSPAEQQVFMRLTAPIQPLAQQLWSDFVALPKWSQKLSYAARKLFPSAAYMRHRYGVKHLALLPLYYVYRWALGFQSAWRWRSRSVSLASDGELDEKQAAGIVAPKGRIHSTHPTNADST